MKVWKFGKIIDPFSKGLGENLRFNMLYNFPGCIYSLVLGEVRQLQCSDAPGMPDQHQQKWGRILEKGCIMTFFNFEVCENNMLPVAASNDPNSPFSVHQSNLQDSSGHCLRDNFQSEVLNSTKKREPRKSVLCSHVFWTRIWNLTWWCNNPWGYDGNHSWGVEDHAPVKSTQGRKIRRRANSSE